jgi:hypothetical protein
MEITNLSPEAKNHVNNYFEAAKAPPMTAMGFQRATGDAKNSLISGTSTATNRKETA